jgi:hypothetical protein
LTWLRRIAWFVAIWAISVGVVGLLAYALRAVLVP